ncbi:MAG: class I SAM-dependent methyltransferase [Candidatus Aminicenantes bacterium]|nr:class I SAM-dependent methyltransferase [Candidatus Aminicenantes bacterium]
MDAETGHVLEKINPDNWVLDLGCGYGRLIPDIAQKAKIVIGVDKSMSSLMLAKEKLKTIRNHALFGMNAIKLAFKDMVFDVVLCVQNGISAFHVNPKTLIKESIRVTKPKGKVLFSTYSEKFWNHRLKWFQIQADAGLLGKIDYTKTGNGVIVCKDGFRATTMRKEQFIELTSEFDVNIEIVEVDQSSLFCEITVL